MAASPWFLREEPIEGPVPEWRRRMYFDYLMTQLTAGARVKSPHGPQQSPTRDKITNYLRTCGPATSEDIANGIGIGLSGVRKTVQIMSEQGLLERSGKKPVLWQVRE